MSFEDRLEEGGKVYVIPRGSTSIKEVIQIGSQNATRVTVYFPHDKYQVITDGTLHERGCTIDEYIKQTES